MLSLVDISFSVEGRLLFDKANTTISDGQKVGLVGRNGVGKTTLLNILKGKLTLEHGSIKMPSNTRIGGVEQEVPGNKVTLLNSVLAADIERSDLMIESKTVKDPTRIAEIQTRLNDINAWSAEARASSILKGLGFDKKAVGMPCSSFSGGWRMRIALAGVLFAEPDLLLLDEPTNYLDLEGAIWLENYLLTYPYTVIVISHDRNLLNRCVTSILHLENKKLKLYAGAYDKFIKTRANLLANAQAETKKQNARRKHLQSYVDRFRYKADKARQAQSRLKAIARLEPISTSIDAQAKQFTFPKPEELLPPILRIENGIVGYNNAPVLSSLNLQIDQDDRIALLGKNGEGKSTLAKLISGHLSCMSGRVVRSNKLRIGYFAQHQMDELSNDETPIDHVRRLDPRKTEKQLRAILSAFGIGKEQAELLTTRLSGGQKARLSLLIATFNAPHLLVLDEPTNHLDIESREALIDALTAYSGAVILVSHDMHLLSLVADRLWLVNEGAVKTYNEDLDSYRRLLLLPTNRYKRISKEKPNKKRIETDKIQALKAKARKNDIRLEKLNKMRDKLAIKLADPTLYEKDRLKELQIWNNKYNEVMEAIEKAEALWMDTEEKLDMLTSN